MATQVLTRPSAVVSKQLKPRVRHATPRAAVAPLRPSAAKLQEIEDQLLADALENHPNFDNAIEHLLGDMECLAAADAARRSTALRHSQLERMEDLLLQAVLWAHPNRENAIERLLGDVVGDAAIDDHDEELERACFDMRVDNDFDGMA